MKEKTGGWRMNKKEWKTEVHINGIPRLRDVPKDLMDAFIEGLIESMDEIKNGKAEKEWGE